MNKSHLGAGLLLAGVLMFSGCKSSTTRSVTPAASSSRVATATAPATPATSTVSVAPVAPAEAVAPTNNNPPGSASVPATRSNPTNWMARHEKFAEQAKQGGVDVLFMGDSITDFWRSRGSNVWNHYYVPLHAADFGISGDRTQHVLWRIEHGELDGLRPKVVVLMIGTNNSGTDSPDDIARAIGEIIAVIHAKTPMTKVLLLGVFPRGPRPNSTPAADDSAKRMEVIRAVNARIAQYDDGGRSVKYLDIGDKFLGPDGKIPSDVMPDQLHPGEKGYQIWAEAMNPTLEAMLQ